MTTETPAHQADTELQALLRASGGKPIVQIVWDPDIDEARIRSAGLDHAAIPEFLHRLGGALVRMV